MSMESRYFIKKDFLKYPLAILKADYEDNKLVENYSNIIDVPKSLPTKLLNFKSFEELENYKYCNCGKDCSYNKEFKKIIMEFSEKEKAKYKGFSLSFEEIEKEVKKFFDEKKPDIIIQESLTTFFATIYTEGIPGELRSTKINTGIGGLKMILKTAPEFNMLYKVKYNGVILNDKQKKKLFDEILNIK